MRKLSLNFFAWYDGSLIWFSNQFGKVENLTRAKAILLCCIASNISIFKSIKFDWAK